MKKIRILLAVALIFTLCGCSAETAMPPAPTETPAPTTTPAPTATPTDAPEEERFTTIYQDEDERTIVFQDNATGLIYKTAPLDGWEEVREK